MDKKQIEKMKSVFDDIAQRTEDGVEFWYARDLMSNLGYGRWENFEKAILRSIDSCKSSGNEVSDHFREVTKMVDLGSGAHRNIKDYMRSKRKSSSC